MRWDTFPSILTVWDTQSQLDWGRKHPSGSSYLESENFKMKREIYWHFWKCRKLYILIKCILATKNEKIKNWEHWQIHKISRIYYVTYILLVRIRKWTENGRISTDIFISCGKKYRPINLTKNAIRPSPSTLSLITRPFMDLSKSSPKVQCHSFRTWTEWVDLNIKPF